MSSHQELIVLIGPLAHHAGYRKRIHWDQAHCARGFGVVHPIGQCLKSITIGHDVTQLPIGQGVGR